MAKRWIGVLSKILIIVVIGSMAITVNADDSKAYPKVFAVGANTIGITDKGELWVIGENAEEIKEIYKGPTVYSDFSGQSGIVGLTEDGKMVTSTSDGSEAYEKWGEFKEVADVIYFNGGLREDGTVALVSKLKNSEDVLLPWKNIVSIESFLNCPIYQLCGIDDSGKVYFAGCYWDNENSSIVAVGNVGEAELFTDIVKLDGKHIILAGVKKDGTVIAYDYLLGSEIKVDWTDIVDIAVTDGLIIYGLKSDGTVVSTSKNQDLSSWTDIAYIYAGSGHVIGVSKAGKIFAAGNNSYGQCDVNSWDLTPLAGDANDDDEVNAKDALAILKVAAKIDDFGTEFIPKCWSPLNAKVTEGSADELNATDALEILRYAAGIIKEFK